jgi:hypothetical protein
MSNATARLRDAHIKSVPSISSRRSRNGSGIAPHDLVRHLTMCNTASIQAVSKVRRSRHFVGLGNFALDTHDEEFTADALITSQVPVDLIACRRIQNWSVNAVSFSNAFRAQDSLADF